MPRPTFINSYDSGWQASGTTKTASLFTQPGDVLVVYVALAENITADSIAGNSVSFTRTISITQPGGTTSEIWTGTDTTGGWWILTATATSATLRWGIECFIFRNSSGIGASVSSQSAQTLGITTTANNSAIVAGFNDGSAPTAPTRSWATVNGITPTNINTMEREYYAPTIDYAVFCAYYSDAGSAGTVTVGLSSPVVSGPFVAVEVLGKPDGPWTAAWVGAN